MTVLNVSAILALVHDEPGADQVRCATRIQTQYPQLAEVVGKLVDADIAASQPQPQPQPLLMTAGVAIEQFLAADAELAGAIGSTGTLPRRLLLPRPDRKQRPIKRPTRALRRTLATPPKETILPDSINHPRPFVTAPHHAYPY